MGKPRYRPKPGNQPPAPVITPSKESVWVKILPAIVAFVIGLISAWIAYTSGAFDARKRQLDAEKAKLELENASLTLKGQQLQLDIRTDEDRKQGLQKDIAAKADSLNKVRLQIAEVNSKLKSSNSQLITLKDQLSAVGGKYSKLVNTYDTPLPMITGNYIPDESGDAGIYLRNNGTSLINIDEYKVYTKTRNFIIDSYKKGFEMTPLLDVDKDVIFGYFPRNSHMQPNTETLLIGFHNASYKLEDQGIFQQLEENVFITLKYHSASGKPGKMLTFGNKALFK